MQALEEYRKPRDALLILVSDFIRICAPRLEELEEASLPPRYTVPELLDHISVNVRVVSNHLTKTYIEDITWLRRDKKLIFERLLRNCLSQRGYVMFILPTLPRETHTQQCRYRGL